MIIGSTAMVFLGLLVGSVGATAGNKVVRFPVQSPAELPEPVRESLIQSVDAALTQAGFEVAVAGAACADAPCYEAALADNGADLGVQVLVTAQGSDYSITASFVDSSGVAQKSDGASCDICNHDEVVGRVSAVVGGIAAELAPPAAQATVSIVSSPSGANVFIDGQPVGNTPYEGELPEGTHTVRLENDGYASSERSVEAVAGSSADEAFTLDRQSRIKMSPKTEMIIGFAALGAGVAAVAGGAVLLAIDENDIENDCSGENVDANGICKYRYNTLVGGAVLVAGGILATGGGVALILHGRKRGGMKKKAEISLSPTGLVGRF